MLPGSLFGASRPRPLSAEPHFRRGLNKATGLQAALKQLSLSVHNTVGVGDAENDHAFLGICECAVAVGNALPSVKDKADFVTAATHGTGVTQLIEEMLADDLASREPSLRRHHIRFDETCNIEHHRHVRKYAEGELPEDRSFFFRGPQGKRPASTAPSK